MRLIDADIFEVVGTKIPEGMDPESYMAGMDFVLNKIDDAPTIEPEVKFIRLPNENPVDMFPLLTEEDKQQSREYAQGYSDAIAERKKGEWISAAVEEVGTYKVRTRRCTYCGERAIDGVSVAGATMGIINNFCPNCGARMEG